MGVVRRRSGQRGDGNYARGCPRRALPLVIRWALRVGGAVHHRRRHSPREGAGRPEGPLRGAAALVL